MMHCHHEKLVIVDDEIAFVGGIDLTTLAGDRYDSSEHPHKEQEIGWHDATSRAARADRARRRRPFRAALGGDGGRGAAAAGGPSRRPATPPSSSSAPSPRARTACCRAASSRSSRPTCARCAARSRLIYLENQFLWSPEIVHILETKLRDPPSDDFRVVVLLPHKANNGQDDTRGMLGRLVAADDGAKRFLATTIMSRSGERSGPLYVHAKIGIVDDAWLAIGSANLNEHSLFNDTEVDVVTCDPRLARDDASAPVGRAPRARRRIGRPGAGRR